LGRVLVVEDERRVAAALKAGMEEHGLAGDVRRRIAAIATFHEQRAGQLGDVLLDPEAATHRRSSI
jgi:DNA-binding response OmpR family regulator